MIKKNDPKAFCEAVASNLKADIAKNGKPKDYDFKEAAEKLNQHGMNKETLAKFLEVSIEKINEWSN